MEQQSARAVEGHVVQHPERPEYDPFAPLRMQQPSLIVVAALLVTLPATGRVLLPTLNAFPDFELLFFVTSSLSLPPLLPPLLP